MIVRITWDVCDGWWAATKPPSNLCVCVSREGLYLLSSLRVEPLFHGAAIGKVASRSGNAGNYCLKIVLMTCRVGAKQGGELTSLRNC